MRVLLVGSGGREHALAWRLTQSPNLTDLWVAGGNAGTAQLAENLPVSPEDVEGVVGAAQSHDIDLVVVGPEVPLALGLADRLGEEGIAVFGPSQAAARLESSKSFARQIMSSTGVPSPEYRVFHESGPAVDYVQSVGAPVVVKADGLAAGKGAVVCSTVEDACLVVKDSMEKGVFGAAGRTVVIEECLSGFEVSLFAFCDGDHLSNPVAAGDYKRAGDGDRGPNTGGMGSVTPPPGWSAADSAMAMELVMRPTVDALAERGTPFRGVLYAGLMVTESGPRVLEFNCRFGDPEAQVILPLLVSDPIEVMIACAEGRLSGLAVEWSQEARVGVVMASGGYPDHYETGFEISGLEAELPHTQVFHAGTRRAGDGANAPVVTSGGRVLTVVGAGDTAEIARERAYQRVHTIGFQGAFWRTDIGAAPAAELAG